MGISSQAAGRPWSPPVPLEELIRGPIDELLRKHAADIVCELDLDPQITIRAMPEKVCELVQTLVRQSLQEMEQGGELTITAWSDGQRVELEIADTGCPVAERPTRLPLVAAAVGARLQWQDCPQGGAAVTIDLGYQAQRRQAA